MFSMNLEEHLGKFKLRIIDECFKTTILVFFSTNLRIFLLLRYDEPKM